MESVNESLPVEENKDQNKEEKKAVWSLENNKEKATSIQEEEKEVKSEMTYEQSKFNYLVLMINVAFVCIVMMDKF